MGIWATAGHTRFSAPPPREAKRREAVAFLTSGAEALTGLRAEAATANTVALTVNAPTRGQKKKKGRPLRYLFVALGYGNGFRTFLLPLGTGTGSAASAATFSLAASTSRTQRACRKNGNNRNQHTLIGSGLTNAPLSPQGWHGERVPYRGPGTPQHARRPAWGS